ncbi:nucleolus and neural progenitor protein [Stigmatopora argus]
MAAEPWNKINIPLPSAIHTIFVQFTPKTAETITRLLIEIEKTRLILRSKILQTEIRLLYALLYTLNNSARGNITFRVLKRVEQCINRLREMKLDIALLKFSELCPKIVRRKLSLDRGSCELPSQPIIEWQCLKVMGAAQLLKCTLKHCRKAFLLSKQHMKIDFEIRNLTITSMVSRIWFFFRGILSRLLPLYQDLYALGTQVALARPMPFLLHFELPANLSNFLDLSGVDSITSKPKSPRDGVDHDSTKKRMCRVKAKRTKKIKEDLGVAVQRKPLLDSDIKPVTVTKVKRVTGTKVKPVTVTKVKPETVTKVKRVTVTKVKPVTFTKTVAKKNLPKEEDNAKRKRSFHRHVRKAATFKDVAFTLEEMIKWCTSKKRNRTKQRLTFLRLKCRRLTGAEALGYNVQNKLRKFKQDACQAPCGIQSPFLKRRYSFFACQRSGRLRKSLWSFKMNFLSSKVRNNVKKRVEPKKHLSSAIPDDDWIRKIGEMSTPSLVANESYDDIDTIFASVGVAKVRVQIADVKPKMADARRQHGSALLSSSKVTICRRKPDKLHTGRCSTFVPQRAQTAGKHQECGQNDQKRASCRWHKKNSTQGGGNKVSCLCTEADAPTHFSVLGVTREPISKVFQNKRIP